MIPCDALSHSKLSQDVLNIVWLVLHVFGILANLYAHYKLRKRWNLLGNFSISLEISILSNILALLCHSYLPLNSLVRNFTGLQWSFGSFCCVVLPRLANFAVAVSTLVFMVVMVQKYHKVSSGKDITPCEAETTMIIMLATAILILSPEFYQCGVAKTNILVDQGICTGHSPWKAMYQGRLYEALRLVLQYVIPVAFILSALAKLQFKLRSAKYRCLDRFLSIMIDCMAFSSIALFVYLFPVKVMMLGGKEVMSKHDAVPNTVAAIEIMDYIAICCCIAAPFEIIEMIKDEDKEIQENEIYAYKEAHREIFLAGDNQEKANLVDPVNKEVFKKRADQQSVKEFLEGLMNGQTLQLKNEIVV